jgi:hypothetical protein
VQLAEPLDDARVGRVGDGLLVQRAVRLLHVAGAQEELGLCTGFLFSFSRVCVLVSAEGRRERFGLGDVSREAFIPHDPPE